jgi:hypothetical protein
VGYKYTKKQTHSLHLLFCSLLAPTLNQAQSWQVASSPTYSARLEIERQIRRISWIISKGEIVEWVAGVVVLRDEIRINLQPVERTYYGDSSDLELYDDLLEATLAIELEGLSERN